jgi:transcription factor 1
VQPFLKELEDLETRHSRGEFAATIADKRAITPEYRRLQRLRHYLAYVNKRVDETDLLVSEYESIIAEQIQIATVEGDDTNERKQQLRERFSALRDKLERMSTNQSDVFYMRIDDRRAFRQDPPVLFWDRREAEPLVVKEKEFFPQHELCLLDFHPKSVWPIIQGHNIPKYDYLESILSSLYLNPKYSIARGLRNLAPGADEWIIPRCPSLTNPAKGGSLDVSELSVRCLNQDMLKEIMEAWMSWPFRPTKSQMIFRAGNSAYLDEESSSEFELEHD